MSAKVLLVRDGPAAEPARSVATLTLVHPFDPQELEALVDALVLRTGASRRPRSSETAT